MTVRFDDVCAYCGEHTLTGAEPPEHPIPAAIGASLKVLTVCAPCNGWASREIDRPFLRDDWVLIERARHRIRDHRRPASRARVLVSPLLQGHTEDGVFVSVDPETGVPRIHPHVVRDEERGVYQVHAPTREEAERLLARIERQARREGRTTRVERIASRSERPQVTGRVKVELGVWVRMAAKVALGVASHAYPPEWRCSPCAEQLRRCMREPDPQWSDGVAARFEWTLLEQEDPRRLLVDPPQHLVWFAREAASGTVRVCVLLFGATLFSLPVAEADTPLPEVAWLLDPRRPRASGETTLRAIVTQAVVRMAREAERQQADDAA
jgi:hypothetical protein